MMGLVVLSAFIEKPWIYNLPLRAVAARLPFLAPAIHDPLVLVVGGDDRADGERQTRHPSLWRAEDVRAV
jgi:hypothetical protein